MRIHRDRQDKKIRHKTKEENRIFLFNHGCIVETYKTSVADGISLDWLSLIFSNLLSIIFEGRVNAICLKKLLIFGGTKWPRKVILYNLSGNPWWKLKWVYLSWEVLIKKVIWDEKLFETWELSSIIPGHKGNHKCAHLHQVFQLWNNLLLILILKVTLWLIDFSSIDITFHSVCKADQTRENKVKVTVISWDSK